MKTILYATDFSENSVSALRFADLLSKKFDAKLIVMHVFDIPISIASPVTISYINKEKKLFVENRTKLKAFYTQHIGVIAKDANINFVAVEDVSVSNGILEKALKFNADLICVGTKGVSALKELILGSNTKALIVKAACAVLAVPENIVKPAVDIIVYATDFESADILAIRRLVKIAQKFHAKIRVVHVTTRNEYAGEEQMLWFKDMLKEKIEYAFLEFDLIFSESILEDLLWRTKDVGADILAMLERKHGTFYQNYMQPDLVLKILKAGQVPLLSFNKDEL